MAIKSWSTTAASNVNALTGVGLGFDENQAPSLVNNAARELMAQVAAFVADAYQGKCDYYAAGGTANAITVTANPAATAYAAGQGYHILASNSNTGATTLNVNALGAKAIQYQGQALKGGEIVANRLVHVMYDGTQFQLLTPFIYAVQDTTNKHLGLGSGVFASGTGGTTEGNLAIGQGALDALTDGYGNFAIGVDALGACTGGDLNTAVGFQAGDAITTGNNNVALGNAALGATAAASNNTGIGRSAGLTNTTGAGNTLIGYGADVAANNDNRATAIGENAVAGDSGIAIGAGAVAADNCISLASATYTLTLNATGRSHSTYLPIKVNGVQYYISLQT